jgi:hypothetical protein
LEAANQVMALRRPGDLIVVSIHWGSNWGYHVPDEQKILARALIDKAGVSIVHGHSSHHPRAIEIYRDRLILYGCGDFLNDYEGIRGYERYRDDLALMYFADLDPASGSLHALRLVPLQIKNFRLSNPSWRDIEWIQQTLDGECQQFGTRSFSIPNGSLLLSGLGQGPSGRAIRTHDLEQTLRARFGRPLPDVSGTGARGPFPAVAPPITLQLAGWWASPYLGRKGAIPREADWTRGRRRGCSPPPKLADTGWSGLGVWRATRSRGALTSMPGSSADAESGPRAEIMRRSGHGDRTHYIRHHHD